jgi:hypothetical protein
VTQSYLQTSESKDATGNPFMTFASGALASTHAGNLLHLQISWAGQLSPDNVHFAANTITDTQNNKWAFIGVTTGGGHFCAHWYAANIAGGACTATVNANPGASGITYPDVLLSEVAGVNTLVAHDETGSGSEGAGAPFSSNPMQVPASDLPCLLASYCQDSGVSVLAAPGAGFTSVFVGGNLFGSNTTGIESLAVSAAGSVTANWISTNADAAGYYIMSVVWCLVSPPAAGGGSESPKHRLRRLQLKPSYPVPAYLDQAQQVHWSSARVGHEAKAHPAAKRASPPAVERLLLTDLPNYVPREAPEKKIVAPMLEKAVASVPETKASAAAPETKPVMPAPETKLAVSALGALSALRALKMHPSATLGRVRTMHFLEREGLEAFLALLNGDAETPAGKA